MELLSLILSSIFFLSPLKDSDCNLQKSDLKEKLTTLSYSKK